MKHARILVEGQSIIGSNRTGVGNYALNLVNQLAKFEPIDGFYFDFLDRNKYSDHPLPFKPVAIKHLPGRLLSLVARTTGLQLPVESLLVRRYDWIIYPNYVSLPSIFGAKSLIVIYDMAFMDMPETLEEKNLKYLREMLPKSIKRADKILCISEFTRNRLLYNFPEIDPKDVITAGIPLTLPDTSRRPMSTRLRKRGIDSGHYILFLGTLEPRKNLSNLVDAYMQLPETTRANFSLVLAGGKGWKSERLINKIQQAQKAGYKIILPGYVSDEERLLLYANAKLYVMPSHYEGFGMPLLEAMSFNIPCIASDIPVFREVAEDTVSYFDKDSIASIKQSIQKAISSSKPCTYRKILNKYTWDDTVSKIIEVIQK